MAGGRLPGPAARAGYGAALPAAREDGPVVGCPTDGERRLLQATTMGKDYYKELGVSKDADAAALKKAYRKLAVKWVTTSAAASPLPRAAGCCCCFD